MADETTQMNSAAAPVAAATPQTPPPPQQLEYKVAGSVFRGKTYEEIVEQMGKSIEHGNQRIHELSRQIPPPPTSEPEQYNAAKAYELFASDPREYERYMRRFDPEHQRLAKVAEEVEDYKIATEFKTVCTDFPETSEDAQNKLLEVAGNLMAQYGKEKLDVPTMVMAHEICKRQHFYEPVTQQIVTAATSNPNTPPPPPPASSTQNADQAPDPWKMTTEQLKQFIESQGVKQ